MSKIDFFVQLQINLVFSWGWFALIRSPKLAVFSVSPQSSILEKKKYNKRICLLQDDTEAHEEHLWKIFINNFREIYLFNFIISQVNRSYKYKAIYENW